MNLKAVEQTFFNSFAGKTSFRAVVLPEDLGSNSSNRSSAKILRVRPLDVHDFIIPEPCQFKSDPLKVKKVISLHPVAYPDDSYKFLGGDSEDADTIGFGHIIECFFKDGPQSGGRLRRLTYRPGIVAINRGSVDLTCISGGNVDTGSDPFEGGGYEPNPPPRTPTTPVTLADHPEKTDLAKTNYDNAAIPNKNQHKPFLELAHKDFATYVKLIIAEAWTTKQIEVTLASGFRTVYKQTQMRKKWDEWHKGLPADKKNKIKSKKDWITQGKPKSNGKEGYGPGSIVYRPATGGNSNHNFGCAIDFSIKYNSKTYSVNNEKKEWEATGFPNIIRKNGLRWGGDFGDKIHMDFGSVLTAEMKTEIKELTAEIKNEKKAIEKINTITIVK